MQEQVYSEMSALEGTHWWFTARRKYLRQVIATFFSDRNNLYFCEFGCGTGGNLPMLGKFALVDALEMNDTARQLIIDKNIRGVTNVYPGYLPNNITLNRRYDGVFSLDVIEHVEDDLATLKALKNYLNDEGLLITTVPAYQWLWSEHDVANHHFRRYTKSHYCQLVRSAGYDICYASYFNSLLFPLAALSRLIGMLKKKPTGDTEPTLSMPPQFINRLFAGIFGLESYWATKITIPFGLSIIVVAKFKSE